MKCFSSGIFGEDCPLFYLSEFYTFVRIIQKNSMIMGVKGIIFTIISFLSICSSILLSLKQKEDEKIRKSRIPFELREYYEGIDFSKKGAELYEDLAILTIEKHTKFLKYSDRHQFLYKADSSERNPENVTLIYTSEERFWKEYEGNKKYSPNTFNTEHVYPRSKIITQAVTDLHHLRVCDSKVNNRRGNYPFTDGKGEAKLVKKSWFPGDEWKGDVARMILYLNLRYGEELNEDISTGGVDLLLKWNAEDPVSFIEKNRNNVTQQAQGNRNPFIDNPYLATLIWGGIQAENIWK